MHILLKLCASPRFVWPVQDLSWQMTCLVLSSSSQSSWCFVWPLTCHPHIVRESKSRLLTNTQWSAHILSFVRAYFSNYVHPQDLFGWSKIFHGKNLPSAFFSLTIFLVFCLITNMSPAYSQRIKKSPSLYLLTNTQWSTCVLWNPCSNMKDLNFLHHCLELALDHTRASLVDIPDSLFLSPQNLRASAYRFLHLIPHARMLFWDPIALFLDSYWQWYLTCLNGCHLYDWCENLIKVDPLLLLKSLYYNSGLVSGWAAIFSIFQLEDPFVS